MIARDRRLCALLTGALALMGVVASRGFAHDQDRAAEAVSLFGSKMDVIENASYQRLLLIYQGQLTPEALLEQSAAGLDRTHRCLRRRQLALLSPPPF